MARYSASGTSAAIGCIPMALVGIFYAFIVWVVALWTDRNLDFWVSFLKGENFDVPFIGSILLAIFAPFTLLANVISEVIRMCM